MSDLQCPATLIVARHADADYVEDFFSDEGGWLTYEGREQAAGLGKALVTRRIAHVWCSDSARCVQTAEIAAHVLDVGVTTRKSLREVFVGALMGAPFDVARLHEVTDRWYDGDLAAGFVDGESGTDVVARYRALARFRRAVLLVAGDKAGQWKQWYTANIPVADDRFDEWMKSEEE